MTPKYSKQSCCPSSI